MTNLEQSAQTAAYRTILSKRDTRDYLPDPVDPERLDRLINAGRMAGSAKNGQRVRVVAVSDTATKSALATCGDYAEWIPNAPLVLVLCVEAAAGPRRLFDVGRAAQNIMLAATIEGLASCPVTMHRDPCCREALGVPEDIEVPMVITVGHAPPADPGRRSHPRIAIDDFASWGSWGAPRPPALICHLATRSEWEASEVAGEHRPASLDAEGFIHFSTVEQLVATAGRYYAGATDLLVICAHTSVLSLDLRFEQPAMKNSPVGDQFFPHLYRSFSPSDAVLVAPLESDAEGFVLPDSVRALADQPNP